MTILIHGSDVVESRKELLKLKSSYTNQGFRVESFVATKENVDQIKISLLTSSMFAQKNAYFVELDKSTISTINPKSAPEQNVAVFWIEGKIPANSSFLKSLKNINGTILTFEEKRDAKIFKLADFVCQKNSSLALSLLEELLQNQTAGYEILGVLIFQFRNVLGVKLKADFVKKEHPFVLKKSVVFAGNFKEEELLEIYKKLAEADVKIKTGQGNENLVLTELIHYIVRK